MTCLCCAGQTLFNISYGIALYKCLVINIHTLDWEKKKKKKKKQEYKNLFPCTNMSNKVLGTKVEQALIKHRKDVWWEERFMVC